MKYDNFGRSYTTDEELCELLYQNPDLDLTKFQVENPFWFNESVNLTYSSDFGRLNQYLPDVDVSIEEFDRQQQSNWYMPEEYKTMDIAQWVLDQCKSDAELQRVGQELLLYQERDLFNLLRYLKYFVDTMRKHNLTWGLGRGSSVSSYVLYLIGVHKVNSMYYDLEISEFLR